MDTMEITKIVGGLCGALLFLLLGKWAAETIYHVGGGHGDHGDVAQAYSIEVEEVETADAAEEGPSLDELLAVADLAKGEKVFKKCSSCHALADGDNGTGPHLYSIVGREIAAVDGYGFSSALADLGGVWGPEELDGFLAAPKSYAPGTKMGFNGLKKDADRANLIAYLQTIGG